MAKRKKEKSGVKIGGKLHSLADDTFNHQRDGESRGNVVRISARKSARKGKRKATRSRKR